MKTKFFLKFLNNSSHLDTDLEFVDIIQIAVSDGKLKDSDSSLIFDYVDVTKHKKLTKRAGTLHSRKLAANHLKSSIREAFMKSIYENTMAYFQDILKAAIRNGIDAKKLIGEHSRNFTSREIIEAGNHQNLLDSIGSSIFRQLENEKKAKDLIEKMSKKLGLDIESEKINAALPYFDIRHKLVHAEGIADQEFCKKFPNIEAESGKAIRISYELIDQARNHITNLIKDFDDKIVTNNIVASTDLRQ